jgi:hypothetical protein
MVNIKTVLFLILTMTASWAQLPVGDKLVPVLLDREPVVVEAKLIEPNFKKFFSSKMQSIEEKQSLYKDIFQIKTELNFHLLHNSSSERDHFLVTRIGHELIWFGPFSLEDVGEEKVYLNSRKVLSSCGVPVTIFFNTSIKKQVSGKLSMSIKAIDISILNINLREQNLELTILSNTQQSYLQYEDGTSGMVSKLDRSFYAVETVREYSQELYYIVDHYRSLDPSQKFHKLDENGSDTLLFFRMFHLQQAQDARFEKVEH